MVEREHFTNGTCFVGGTGLALMLAAFGVQVSGWSHWIMIGCGYGSGIVLMFLATFWIAKSYLSREPDSAATVSSAQSQDRPRTANLRDRVFILTKDIHKFLRDLPVTNPLPTQPQSKAELWDAIWSRDSGRVDKVVHGYVHRFRDRVVDISHELAENGITIEAKQHEIDPPEIQREVSLRNVEAALIKVLVRLDLESKD